MIVYLKLSSFLGHSVTFYKAENMIARKHVNCPSSPLSVHTLNCLSAFSVVRIRYELKDTVEVHINSIAYSSVALVKCLVEKMYQIIVNNSVTYLQIRG